MQQEVQIEKGEGNGPGGQAGEPEGGRTHADGQQVAAGGRDRNLLRHAGQAGPAAGHHGPAAGR